jgi:hypothetical protein
MRRCGTAIVVATAALSLWYGRSAAVEYFPSDPGPIFNYACGPVTISADGSGGFGRVICANCVVGAVNSYKIDANADILETSYGYFAQAAPDPDIYVYEPGLLYLDFPLDTGKEWQSTAELRYYMGGDALDTVTLHGRVVGPRTVTVAAGEFEVIEVELGYQYAVEDWRSSTTVLWLQRQLGPVNGLESWTGVISTEKTTWGTLKAGYR